MYVTKSGLLLDQAIAEIGVGGPLEAPKAALFTNDFFPVRTSVFADFTIGNFGGLTNVKNVVWGAPFINGLQQAEVWAGLLNWLTTALTLLPITAFGWVLLDTAGTDWLIAERFAESVEFTYSGQNFGMVPRAKWN